MCQCVQPEGSMQGAENTGWTEWADLADYLSQHEADARGQHSPDEAVREDTHAWLFHELCGSDPFCMQQLLRLYFIMDDEPALSCKLELITS